MIRSLKKFLSCLAVSSCIIITGAVAYGQTVHFTIEASRYVESDACLRTSKEGGAKYENICYVTPTLTITGGDMIVSSVRDDRKNVCSGDILLTPSDLNKTKTSKYVLSPEPYQYYHLHGRGGTLAGGQFTIYEGRYTP